MKTKKKFNAIWSLAVAAVLLLAGCADEETYSYTTSSECVVSAATMGALSCEVHTLKPNGGDSTYTITVQGAYYPLSIDQRDARIYNCDSLPVGTDVSRVVFSTFSTTGWTTIKTLETQKDSLFNYADSTDFRVPREITVNATDGVSKRTYTMEIRVHKEEGDSAKWNRMATSDVLADATQQRALLRDGVVYDFVATDSALKVLIGNTETPSEWESKNISRSDIDVRSVQLFEGKFYAATTLGAIVTSEDGIGWSADAALELPAGAKTLIATGTQHLVAAGDSALYSSTDGAMTWQTDNLSDPAALLPAPGAAACLRLSSGVDRKYENLLLTGVKNGAATIWKRDIDLTGAATHPWFHYPALADTALACPALAHATLLPYDGGVLLLGTRADGTPPALYRSTDNGRTWKSNYMKLPAIGSPANVAAAVDENHHIYIMCGGTGEIWRGRINRLGWKQEPDSFVQ